MDLQQFEHQYRQRVRTILERLQSLTLIVAQMEGTIEEVSYSLQDLNRDVETFMAQQRSE